jgi:thermitase
LRADSAVVWAEPNYYAKAPEIDQRSASYIDQRSVAYIDGSSPSDYFYQYAFTQINADHVNNTKGAGVIVAVIDTGVDVTHPVFKSTVPGYDFVGSDTNPAEEGTGPGFGHGTMVAGIVTLVAKDVAIMPIRAFDSLGSAKIVDLNNAIYWATDNGADVINMSWGISTDSNLLGSAVNYALSRGVVLVAAAGNDGMNLPQWPAANPGVLAVGASDQTDSKASFSNYGSFVNVAAPGVDIYSSYPGYRWAWWDGTSFAAPFVSGEAALRIARGGGDVVQIIKNTAVGCCGGLLGSGRIDCLAAVNY